MDNRIGMRVCAMALVGATSVTAVQVIAPESDSFGMMGRAEAAEVDNIVVENVQLFNGVVSDLGEIVSGTVTSDEFKEAKTLRMQFVIPEGTKAGDTATFSLERTAPRGDLKTADGVTFTPGNAGVDMWFAAGMRVPIYADPNDESSAIGTLTTSNGGYARSMTLTFNDNIEQYIDGKVRELYVPFNPHLDDYNGLKIPFDSEISPHREDISDLHSFVLKYANGKKAKPLVKVNHTETFNFSYPSVNRAVEEKTRTRTGKELAPWVDERLYASTVPGGNLGRAAELDIAPQKDPSEVVFTATLPDDAVVQPDAFDIEYSLHEYDYVPYSRLAKEIEAGDMHDKVYGFYNEVSRYDNVNDPDHLSYTFDAKTNTYTFRLRNRKPYTRTRINLYFPFTTPMNGEYSKPIDVKFISGVDAPPVVMDDVAPGHSKEFGGPEVFYDTGNATGSVASGLFDGTPLNVNYDVEVFTEDTGEGETLSGVTSSGRSSNTSSANDPIFIEDGEANYVLKITNKSNVALSAPVVTLPDGTKLAYTRPIDGSEKKWATPTDNGSKIPVGGIGYLVVPAEKIPFGTMPTAKDFTVSYQYVDDPDNTQTATAWISRKLADAYVVDAFNDGREVVIQVGTAEDGVLETFRFGLGESIINITYDKATNTLVVQDANGEENRIALNTTRLTPGDNNTVVLTGRDGQGNTHSVELVDNVRVNAELTNARTQIQRIIAKYNREITSLQRDVENQTTVLKRREGDAKRAADAAAQAQLHVRDVEIALQNLIIQDQQITQLQLQDAHQRVSDAQQAAQRAQHVVDQTNRELAQFERDIEALRSRVDVQVQAYDELVENYNARESHLRELEQRERTLTTTIMDLRRQINTASDNQAVNEANTQKLQAELDGLTQQVRDNRAAFDAEVKKTQRERDELAQRATRAEGDIATINSDIAKINERLAALDAAIAAAQKDADAVLAASIVSGDRNPDNTIDLNRKDESNITVPEAHKRGLEKCATGVGGAVLAGLPVVLLAATAAAQSNLPGIDAQIARAQRELGVFNPEVAAFIRNNAGAIGATLTAATLIGLLTVPGLCGDQSVIGAIKESAARR